MTSSQVSAGVMADTVVASEEGPWRGEDPSLTPTPLPLWLAMHVIIINSEFSSGVHGHDDLYHESCQ